MTATVEALGEQQLRAAAAIDGSFRVDARLDLGAGDGAIEAQALTVAPYRKRYDATGPEQLRAYLSDPDGAAFVALARGRVIGRVLLSLHWNGYASIDDIAVDAGHRRGGAGAALLERAIEWARQRRLPGLRLETQDHNVAACRFYRRHGFVLGGFDRYHYANTARDAHETALFMYLVFAEKHG